MRVSPSTYKSGLCIQFQGQINSWKGGGGGGQSIKSQSKGICEKRGVKRKALARKLCVQMRLCSCVCAPCVSAIYIRGLGAFASSVCASGAKEARSRPGGEDRLIPADGAESWCTGEPCARLAATFSLAALSWCVSNGTGQGLREVGRRDFSRLEMGRSGRRLKGRKSAPAPPHARQGLTEPVRLGRTATVAQLRDRSSRPR